MTASDALTLLAIVAFVIALAVASEWRSVGRAVRRIGVMPALTFLRGMW